MATRASIAAGLTEAFVREQVASAHTSGTPLPFAVLEVKTEEGELAWRSLAALLRCRAGGFMVVLPFLENITGYLENWVTSDGSPVVLTSVAEVDVETSRGRASGRDAVLLADFPWELLSHFRKPPTGRAQEALGDILRFKKENVVVRPNSASAWEAADQWVANPASEEIQFQEYVTAAEEEAIEPEEVQPGTPLEDVDRADQADILQQMQARLLELESRAVVAQSKAAPTAPSRNLFVTNPQSSLSPATWSKLQAAAGLAPARLGRFEAGTRAGQPRTSMDQSNFLQAEADAEAIDKDEFASLAASMTDPMQKLLALQLKQNQDLLTRVLPRPQDSIASALSGSGNEGGSSSTGVRGCTAREAYLKQMEDHSMVARCVLQNAMRDMGVTTPYPGLMRDYLERRVPLGEMKLLTLFGYFMAHAWETAFVAQDEIFLGFASRGLTMVEQAAMDSGKTQMGWLLTALPEPNWALVNQNRKRQGIQPFARLCQPSWIAANVAFLKDLDFLENRMRSSGNKLEKDVLATEETEKPDRRPKKPWPKPKAKGGGDGASSSANQ